MIVNKNLTNVNFNKTAINNSVKNIDDKSELKSDKLSLRSNYSSNNVKANYLPFGRSVSNSTISFKGGVPVYNDPTKDFKTSLDNLPPSEKMIHNYYNTTADDLAIVMGPDKNAILLHEEDVTPELLIHKYNDNLKKGKYAKEGLNPAKSEVIILDSKKAISGQALPHQALDYIRLAASPQSKKIVFVKDFPLMALAMTQAGVNPMDYFKKGNLKNVQVVGLMSKKILEPKTPEQLQAGERPFPKSLIKSFEQVEMSGLGASDTKNLLKKDRRFKRSVFNRYKNVTLDISDNAVDSLVEQSATKSKKAFPNKALNVLDMVAAAKLNESKVQLDNPKKFKRFTITEPDVKKFFENHSNLLNTADETNKNFQIAENVKTRLADVGGIKEIKEEIQDSILSYIKDSKKFLATGQKAPKGKLLVGEPGTGKTLLASAIAGEANVPFISASGSEFVEKYVGVGAQRVRELFSDARKAANDSEKKIAIVFIDEIDAIGKKRTGEGGGQDETEKTLNQLLTEMDGFNNKDAKSKVIVLGATNRVDVLDPALKRPGRFDDVIEVPAPSKNENARLEILQIHSKGKPFANEAEKMKILKESSKMTMGMSGAELAEVMNKAAKIVAKRPENKVITHNDMVEGFLQVAVGPLKKSDMTDADKKMVVRHEGGHAVVLDTLKHQDISFITLDERGSFLGAVFHQPGKEMPNFKSVIASVATSYAGGLAEPGYEKIGHGAGVSADLKNATGTIEQAVTKWGLGVNTPQLALDEKSPFLGSYSKEIKKDMKLFSDTGHRVAKMIVDFHKDFLDKYVQKYEANAGKGGNNLSGEAFAEMREKWIKDTGREKEYKGLQNKIRKTIKLAQNSNKNVISKLLFKMFY